MAAWVGAPTASRPEITKHMWAYVKERGLQVRWEWEVLWGDAWVLWEYV